MSPHLQNRNTLNTFINSCPENLKDDPWVKDTLVVLNETGNLLDKAVDALRHAYEQKVELGTEHGLELTVEEAKR